MGLQSKNFEAINLTGTMGVDILGDGYTANTVHQILCLTTGNISITAMGGGTFTWAATANTSIDIVPSSITVSSGTFVGFRAKNQGISYTPNHFNG
jgi:hypothetical protein